VGHLDEGPAGAMRPDAGRPTAPDGAILIDGDGGVTVVACDETAPLLVGEQAFARLTRRQYQHTVRDVLGVDLAFANIEANDDLKDHMIYNGPELDTFVNAYAATAEQVAGAVTFPLPGTTCAEDACIAEALSAVGGGLFRRPLAADEVEPFAELFQVGRSELGLNTEGAARLALSGMLQSPSFLMRAEVAVSANAGEIAQLDGYDVAARLAAFLWESAPDAALLAAARGGELDDVAGVERWTRTMLADGRADRALIDFHLQWLGLKNNVQDLPPHTDDAELLRGMQADLWARFTQIGRAGTFADLIAGRSGYPNSRLATETYGVSGGAADISNPRSIPPVELDDPERAGVLSSPFFLSVRNAEFNGNVRNSFRPVIIAARLRENMLCLQNEGAPPGALEANEAFPATTAYEVSRTRQSNDACKRCHAPMDPIGLLFARYDHLGRVLSDAERTAQTGVPAGASFEVSEAGAELDGRYESLSAFAQSLAESDIARRCYAGRWTLFALGRSLENTSADGCTMHRILRRFAESGYRIDELLVAITTSDAFLYRRAGEPLSCQ
jgi:Protein of unknown function (DUF1592)/Protein of unknown function (DUF1585)/Protein of unknown function (DUF1595)/Protein of unknown function (DUF1588)/Protein of unknown function (DUF1587)